MSSVANRQQTVNAAERTKEGDNFSALVIQIFRLNGLLSEAGDALAKPAGQSTARWQVLAAAEDAPVTVAQIARSLGLTRQSVQRVANVLAAEGLGAYQANPHDKRADLFTLSDAGISALRDIQARQVVWANTLGARISEADLGQAQALLARLAEAVASALEPHEAFTTPIEAESVTGNV